MMSASPRQRIRDVFSEALDRPEVERAAFLDLACDGNREVRAEVESLLAARAKLGSFMAGATVNSLEGLSSVTLDQEVGSQIGPYKLVRRLGGGGFGEVYLAEQRTPIHREVALKVIKPGMDTREVLARFEAERQALAMMDHPHIAKVLEAGATETRRPYFVMDYVPGLPITDFCDAGRLRIRERLKLFITVCQAVQHAHGKGIIHRDLKPTNILVASDREQGIPTESGLSARSGEQKSQPKIIDFGIAKAIAGKLTDGTLETVGGRALGTPEYMSPEQAGGKDVDTRTDIYALGAVLYQLLTGTLPFDRQALQKADPGSLANVICDIDPPRPSTRLAALNSGLLKARCGPSMEEITDSRSTSYGALRRQLRGDLDWIVMKCLEKDRAQRYATADALAIEVGRYLDDLPVSAGPPSRIYRVRKFARRNRLFVPPVIISGLAIIAGLALTLQQARAARLARDEAIWQRDQADLARIAESQQRALAEGSAEKAKREADKSTAVSQFLQEMFASLDPTKQLGRDITVRELLDRALSQLEQRVPSTDPEVEALVRASIGSACLEVGLYETAELQLRCALQWLESLSRSDARTATVLNNLGRTLQVRGQYAAAERYFRWALDVSRALMGDALPECAASLHNLASVLRDQGKLGEAEPLAQEALDLRRRLRGPESTDVAMSLTMLARLREGTGDYKESESLDREALSLVRAHYGEQHPWVTTCLDNLARSLQKQGDYAEAERLLRNSLELKRTMLGESDIEIVWSLNSLAALLRLGAKYEEARATATEALALSQDSLGPEHPAIASAMNTLGLILYETGDMVGAESRLRQALEMRRKALEPEHPEIATSLNNLALVAISSRDFEQAEALLEECLASRHRQLGQDHPMIIASMFNLARSLEAQERFLEAETLYRQALTSGRNVFGDEHPRIAASLVGLGLSLQEMGRGCEAEELLRIALAIRKKALPQRHPDIASSLAALGWVLTDLGNPVEAEPVLRESLEIRLAVLPEGHALSAQAQSLLGHCLSALGCYDEAEPLLIRGYVDLRDSQQATDHRKREAVERVVKLYESWGKPDKAAEYRALLGDGPE